MVLLFSNRKSKLEKEIIEILTARGADLITDKSVAATGGYFTVIVSYKNFEINVNKGIVVILDDTLKFDNLVLPTGIIGICEENNFGALKIFEGNTTTVLTCGYNVKNTLTISSVRDNGYTVSLQREINDIKGNRVLPQDFTLEFAKKYSTQAVLISAAVLCLVGVLKN